MLGMTFALLLTALALALVVWAVLDLNARLRLLENSTRERTPAVVTAAIEDLRTALASVNATNRREFGAIWKRLGLARAAAAPERQPNMFDGSGELIEGDEEFDALVALQKAKPVQPS